MLADHKGSKRIFNGDHTNEYFSDGVGQCRHVICCFLYTFIGFLINNAITGNFILYFPFI